MKVKFDILDEMVGTFELNKENLQKADKICIKNSGNWSNYILGICYDDTKDEICVYADGPWEC